MTTVGGCIRPRCCPRTGVGGGRKKLLQYARDAMLYDPQDGVGAVTGDLLTARYSLAATLLTNGTVLVAGGLGTNNEFFTNCEVFNPQTGGWQPTGSSPIPARIFAHFVGVRQSRRLVTAFLMAILARPIFMILCQEFGPPPEA